MAKPQPPVSSKDRASRFIWEFGQVTIIRNGDEEAPKSDTEPDKHAPDDDEALAAGSTEVTDDQEKKDKP